MDKVPPTQPGAPSGTLATDDDLDPYHADRPGLGWLAPGEQLEPWDFTRDDDQLPIPVTAPPGDGHVPGSPGEGHWADDDDTGPLPIVTKRRRFPLLHVGLLAALVLGSTGVVLALVDYRSGAATGAAQTGTPAGSAHQISAPVDGRDAAGFDLLNGVATVSLRIDPLGEELYRIGTPPDGDVLPRAAVRGDRIQLSLVPSGKTGAGALDITLNSRVRWDLRFAGGTQVSVLDLSGGEIGGVELNGGASRIELTLPRPDGTLTVRMTGGVREFLVHTAEPVPVRVRVGSGAGQVVLDGRSHNGVAAGELFTPARWDDGGDRIDLDAVAGMSALRVD